MERCYPEGLHIHIQNGNNAYDTLRNSLQYLLHPVKDGVTEVKNLTDWTYDPTAWVKARCGSRQSKEWLCLGFDLDAAVMERLKLWRPITKWTGGQLTRFMNTIDRFWSGFEGVFSELSSKLNQMQSVLEQRLGCSFSTCKLVRLPGMLLQWLTACKECQVQYMSAHPDAEKLAQATGRYKEAVLYFSHTSMLKPLRYAPKAYDHILVHHVPALVANLADDAALSLAAVSSSCLESLNKHLKAALRANPGGGRIDNKYELSNDSEARAFRHLCCMCSCGRWDWYEKMRKGSEGPNR